MDLKSTGHRPLAAVLCGVLFAASLVNAPPASAEDVTIWSADLDVKTLNTAQDEFGCSDEWPLQWAVRQLQCSIRRRLQVARHDVHDQEDRRRRK